MTNSAKVFNSRKNLNPIIGLQLQVKIAHHDYRKGLITSGQVYDAELALGKELNR
tara:strand:+ start:209 stop:373 length:165 start_codon:yes stop_codon:yes gene_type:complete